MAAPVRPHATPLADEVGALFAHEPTALADPYRVYARLRDEAPVYRHGEQVLITRYDDARAILTGETTLQGLSSRGSRYRSAAEQHRAEERQRLAEMFGFLEKRLAGADGRHHQRLRRLAQRAFTPRVVKTMEGRIQEITDTLIAGVVHQDVVEMIEDVAYHMPLIVISEMLDISTDDREQLRAWASDLGRFVGVDWRDEEVVTTAHESVFKLRSYLTQLFADRRAGGDTSPLLGALLAAEGEHDGEVFTEDELVAMVTQFVFAGHETSTNFIGNSLVFLLGEGREHWDRMREEPEVVPATVEELLRYVSPTQYVDKLASVDGVLRGVDIRAWDTLSVVVAAANHDPEVFPEPERFDITRGGGHLTFGFGAHHCIGASLARMEASVALRTLTQRFPDMRLLDDEVQWHRNTLLRGPERLPVVLGKDHG